MIATSHMDNNQKKHSSLFKILGQMLVLEYTLRESILALQWRHNERDGVSNHQPHRCLLNGLFNAQIKENIKAVRHWPLWGEFTGERWIPRTKGQ